MKIFFSKSTSGFYNSQIHGGRIPNDSIEISKKHYEALLAEQSSGKKIGADSDGQPIAVDLVYITAQDILNSAKKELRAMREPMLSAVTGIGWEASEAGDDALAQEARNIRNALRDITDDPALNAAQTYEEMRAAGVAAYRRIAAGASSAFAATFKEFKGS